jgi:hypothetical protein
MSLNLGYAYFDFLLFLLNVPLDIESSISHPNVSQGIGHSDSEPFQGRLENLASSIDDLLVPRRI